jgi:hypothetical protein
VAETPRDILARNRSSALDLVQRVGSTRARLILEKSERELQARLTNMKFTGQSFTREQMNVTLAQIREVLKGLRGGMENVLVGNAVDAADKATEGTIDYLHRVDQQYRGISTQPLAIDEAAMFESARVGARASVLRRLSSSGEGAPGAPKEAHPAKLGILQRYGVETVKMFEDELQAGMLQKRSWEDMKNAIVGKSSFLQGKPAFWAERIVRTEVMGAYARGAWEATREADDELGDMVKLVSATFDDRTGSDSFAVHGQIRRVDEAFESWFGLYQHPPNRPNDREIVVPHRISWPIPGYLRWKTDAEIEARWTKEKRKGSPPPRPNMTTVPVDRFGKQQPPKASRTEKRPPRRAVPDED